MSDDSKKMINTYLVQIKGNFSNIDFANEFSIFFILFYFILLLFSFFFFFFFFLFKQVLFFILTLLHIPKHLNNQQYDKNETICLFSSFI